MALSLTLVTAGQLEAFYKTYVVNEVSETLSVIDATTQTVVATVPVGSDPNDVAVTPDGKTVYVVNSGSNTLTVISGQTDTVITTTVVGTRPEEIAISPDGTKAFVTNSVSNDVSVINTTTHALIATVPVGTQPHSIVISCDGRTVYVANELSNTVSVIDAVTNQLLSAPVPVGEFPAAIAVSPCVEAPCSVTGSQKWCGCFVINHLSWLAPTHGPTPFLYRIYRNEELSDLAGSVTADAQLQFDDFRYDLSRVYIYYIVSVDACGNQSEATRVVICSKSSPCDQEPVCATIQNCFDPCDSSSSSYSEDFSSPHHPVVPPVHRRDRREKSSCHSSSQSQEEYLLRCVREKKERAPTVKWHCDREESSEEIKPPCKKKERCPPKKQPSCEKPKKPKPICREKNPCEKPVRCDHAKHHHSHKEKQKIDYRDKCY